LKIAVISDIHSNLDAFEAVIANLPEHQEVVCLGDIVGYGPQPNEVVERLQQLEPNAVLMGNHDYAVVTGDSEGFSAHAAEAVEWTRRKISPDNQSYLASLKPSARLERDGRSLALFHGSPRGPLTEYVFPGIQQATAREVVEEGGASIVLLGHTHMPMLYAFDSEMLGNPGSVGQPRDGDCRASFAILSVMEAEISFEIRRVEYNIESVADKIIQAGLPRFLAYRLYSGV
jgi:putative phosphoesterase